MEKGGMGPRQSPEEGKGCTELPEASPESHRSSIAEAERPCGPEPGPPETPVQTDIRRQRSPPMTWGLTKLPDLDISPGVGTSKNG